MHILPVLSCSPTITFSQSKYDSTSPVFKAAALLLRTAALKILSLCVFWALNNKALMYIHDIYTYT